MTQEVKAMANEISLAFKAPEEMERAIGQMTVKTDRNKSEILRACVCLALPILKSNPSLIYRIDFGEFDSNQS
jgi:hypothetical protein